MSNAEDKEYCQNQIAAMLKIMDIAKAAGLICGVWHKAAVEKDFHLEIPKETWEAIVGDNALEWDWSSMNDQIINAVEDAGKED